MPAGTRVWRGDITKCGHLLHLIACKVIVISIIIAMSIAIINNLVITINHHLHRNFTSSDRRFGFYNEEVFTKDLIVMHYLSTCSCFFTIRYDYVYNWMVHCTMYIQPLDPHIHILLKLAPFILSDAVVYFNGQETCFAIFFQDGKHVYTWRLLCNGLLLPFQTN